MKEGKSNFLALFHSLRFPRERDPFIPERRKKCGVDICGGGNKARGLRYGYRLF